MLQKKQQQMLQKQQQSNHDNQRIIPTFKTHKRTAG